MNSNKKILRWCLLFLSVFVVYACNIKNTDTFKDESVFQLSILTRDVGAFDKGLGQDWETAWPTLQNAFPNKIEYTFFEDDVESYDWSNQVITLTSPVTDKFLDDSTIILGNRDVGYLRDRAFVVSYAGELIYGGLFLREMPVATAFNYPVSDYSLSNDRVIFKLRPYHQVFEIPSDDPGWGRIKDERVKELFDQLGKLVE